MRPCLCKRRLLQSITTPLPAIVKKYGYISIRHYCHGGFRKLHKKSVIVNAADHFVTISEQLICFHKRRDIYMNYSAAMLELS